jgi:hypothetical protein
MARGGPSSVSTRPTVERGCAVLDQHARLRARHDLTRLEIRASRVPPIVCCRWAVPLPTLLSREPLGRTRRAQNHDVQGDHGSGFEAEPVIGRPIQPAMAALGLGPRTGEPERPFAGSAADLAPDPILLLIERALFGSGDVTTVLPRHEALLRANKAVLGKKRARLVGGDLALATLLIDALVS